MRSEPLKIGLLILMLLGAPVRGQQTAAPAPVPAAPPAPAAVVGPAASGPVPPAAAVAPAAMRFEVPDPDRKLEWPINFPGTPVQGVLEYYARLTGRSIIQSPTVTGTINFQSQANLSVREAIQALDTVLAINGIAVVPMGEKFLKVVQIATAKQEGLPIAGEGAQLSPADGLVTQIIPLQYAEAADAVAALQPYLHAYGQLLALAKSNSILITDTGANIRQMLEIIGYLDRPSMLRMETRVYILHNAHAADVVAQVQSIIQETQQLTGGQPGAPTQPGQPRVLPRPGLRQPASATAGGEGGSFIEGKVIITSDERTNKIFVLSRPSNFPFFEQFIEELDAKVEPDVMTAVIELDYANSEEMASLLNSLISGAALPTRTTGTGTTRTAGQAPAPATPLAAVIAAGESIGLFEFAQGVRVIPDARTNSLLVMATRADMDRLKTLVHNLDGAVAQVLIEVVIAEVNLKGDLRVGVELLKRVFQEGQVISGGGTKNLGEPGVEPTNLAAEALPALGSGGLTYFLTLKNTKLDAVVRAMATSSRFKVLSTPILQTQHNKEADIIVGESRPIVTSTVSDVTSADVTAQRSNVEYRDIAIEMKVTPRINPDGFVTMEIEQKINDIGGETEVAGVGKVPIITKREARATVSVRDKNTIVLGGLIREDRTVTESKTPFLGDIPLLGHLFKSQTRNKNRTELIVFIRPTVLRDELAASAEAQRRSRELKASKDLTLDNLFENKPAFGGSTNETFDSKELQQERREDAQPPAPPPPPPPQEVAPQP